MRETAWQASGPGGPDRKAQFWELAVFLFLIVPSMALSFFAIKQGSLSFVLTAVVTILRDLALVSLLLYFIWRNGEPVSAIGWKAGGISRELALGAALFVPMFLASSALDGLLHSVGFSAPSTPVPAFAREKGAAETLLAALMVVVVALSEETIFRGYLILRLRSLTSNSVAAVVLSAAIFSLGHGYEGTAGVLTTGFMGAVFALVYLWRGSLVAPVMMHFLQDFLAIVVVPLLGQPGVFR
jgi:membrane protease YdiL (CAAX protease family)